MKCNIEENNNGCDVQMFEVLFTKLFVATFFVSSLKLENCFVSYLLSGGWFLDICNLYHGIVHFKYSFRNLEQFYTCSN